MKIRFIVNPNAGTSERVEEISEAVTRVYATVQGIFEVRVTKSSGDAYRLSEDARDKGYSTVFACGGDGTINEVASALVNTPVALGIIPAGSGNGLAHALGIPPDIEEAVALASTGRVRKIDAGVIGERYFFSTAGFGFDALVSKRYNDRVGGRRGILPYVPIVLREFMRFKPEATIIKIDDKYMRVFPFFLTAANTPELGASAVIAPGAKPDDGLLDICLVQDIGLFEALRYTVKLFKGNIDREKKFRRRRGSSFELTRSNPGVVHVDGEPFEVGRKVKVSLLPGALKVWVK